MERVRENISYWIDLANSTIQRIRRKKYNKNKHNIPHQSIGVTSRQDITYDDIDFTYGEYDIEKNSIYIPDQKYCINMKYIQS